MRMRFGSLMAALGLSLILGTQSAPAQPSSEPTDSPADQSAGVRYRSDDAEY